MATRQMFSSESDLQARCLNLKGESSSTVDTHRNSTKSPFLQTAAGELGVIYLPPRCPGCLI